MTSGIKSKDIKVGDGTLAEHGKTVVVHARGFLNRGEECFSTHELGQPLRIDLSKRDCIAGLQKGIEGMRVGGRRELIVSPHLAYGDKGVPGRIPSNAIIRFEVDLLEVVEHGVVSATFYPPGKHLCVSYPGEAARNLSRWQFGLREGSSVGVHITHPLPTGTWRHARSKYVELTFDPAELVEILQNAESIPTNHSQDCLPHDALWSDHSEKPHGITRSRKTNDLCVTILIYKGGVLSIHYALPETSPVLTHASFYQLITRALVGKI